MKEAIKLATDSLISRDMPWYMSLIFAVVHAGVSLLYSNILVIAIVAKDAVAFSVLIPVILLTGFLAYKTFESFRQSCKWWNRYWHWWHEKRLKYYSLLYHETKLDFLTDKISHHCMNGSDIFI